MQAFPNCVVCIPWGAWPGFVIARFRNTHCVIHTYPTHPQGEFAQWEYSGLFPQSRFRFLLLSIHQRLCRAGEGSVTLMGPIQPGVSYGALEGTDCIGK